MLSQRTTATLILSLASTILSEPMLEPWERKYGHITDLSYSGFNSFAHLPHTHEGCLRTKGQSFDLAVIGAPYDGGVSFRTGARFGPFGIRSGSRRQRPDRGYHPEVGINPYKSNLTILDCGDIPMSPYSPSMALDQLQVGYSTLLGRNLGMGEGKGRRIIDGLSLDGKERPRIVTMGGDHTIVLPILRSLYEIYGPISVIHLDAHLDTWNIDTVASESGETHGTFFHSAANEGLLGPSIHVGIRTRLSDIEDYTHDALVGFQLVTTDMIDVIGTDGIKELVEKRVADKRRPVYISLDIDVVDPSAAPATGTMEPGGFTSREIKRIIRNFKGLNIVGVDVVEVAPAYDTNAEITSVLAADLIHEFLSIMVKGDVEFQAAEEKKIIRDEL